jgi:hypothetical protein
MIKVAIHTTSSGFVSPSPYGVAYCSSAFDGAVEQKLAECAQVSEFPAGVYVAKWTTYRGAESEYVFAVAVDPQPDTRRIEVAP